MEALGGNVFDVGVPESDLPGAGCNGCGRPAEGSLDFLLKV